MWLGSRPPTVEVLSDLLAFVYREYDPSSENCSSLLVELVYELGDDAEVGSTATDAPEEVGVLSVVGDDSLAISGHNCDLYDCDESVVWKTRDEHSTCAMLSMTRPCSPLSQPYPPPKLNLPKRKLRLIAIQTKRCYIPSNSGLDTRSKSKHRT